MEIILDLVLLKNICKTPPSLPSIKYYFDPKDAKCSEMYEKTVFTLFYFLFEVYWTERLTKIIDNIF